MALHGVNMADWETLENKTEKTPIPYTDRIIEVWITLSIKKKAY